MEAELANAIATEARLALSLSKEISGRWWPECLVGDIERAGRAIGHVFV